MNPKLIIVLGSTGYIGSAFCAELLARRIPHLGLSRHSFDYTDFGKMRELLHAKMPSIVINCAAFIPMPSVDLCRENRDETLKANLLLPDMLAKACELSGAPFAHIGTACLYDDKKEYIEDDPPTRGWDGYCGFYLGTKYLSELAVRKYEKSYVWRIRLPFDELDNPRNYLSKLRRFPTVWDHINSLTHRKDFVGAALLMLEREAPYGVYNMVNTGSISAREIGSSMMGLRVGYATGPITGSRLSCAKLESTGVRMRPAREAVLDAVRNWKSELCIA